MPDRTEKTQLVAIPTGSTLQFREVGLMVTIGETAATTSGPLHRFLDSHPLRPARPQETAAPKALPPSSHKVSSSADAGGPR